MSRLVFSQRSQQDLIEAFDYIARHAPEAAARFVEAIIATCEAVGANPRMGGRRDDIDPGLRLFSHRTYGIYYRFDEQHDTVRVSRVLHHSRDTQRLSFD